MKKYLIIFMILSSQCAFAANPSCSTFFERYKSAQEHYKDLVPDMFKKSYEDAESRLNSHETRLTKIDGILYGEGTFFCTKNGNFDGLTYQQKFKNDYDRMRAAVVMNALIAAALSSKPDYKLIEKTMTKLINKGVIDMRKHRVKGERFALGQAEATLGNIEIIFGIEEGQSHLNLTPPLE